MTRLTLVCVCTALCLLFAVPTAQAAKCGARPRHQSEPVAGTLLLKPELSDGELNFERGTGEQRLIFVFGVTGCTLNSGKGLVARPHSSDLEVSKVFGKATFEAEGSQLWVELPVHGAGFNPGKHSVSIAIHGPTVVPWISKVSVQRTEELLWPAIIGILALLIGAIAGIVKARDSSSETAALTPLRVIGALIAAAVAAGAVWISGYLKVEIWTGDVNSWITLVGGILAAAFGATTGAMLKKA